MVRPAAEELKGFALIGVGVIFFGTASLLVRLAFPMTPMEVTFGRLFTAAVLVTLIAAVKKELKGWIADAPRYWKFGLVMSLHFLFFAAALGLTSIAHALSITYLAPALIAVISARRLGERLSRRQVAGIALSIAGVATLTGFEPEATAKSLAGDLLALLSAVMFALYSITGRIRRATTPLFAYTSRLYVWAAIWAIPFAVASFQPSAYTWGRAGAMALSGVLPIGIGHTLYNAAVKHISATKTNLVATQEVTGGVLLGAILLAEVPGWNSILGAAINLAGVFLVILGGPSRSSAGPED